VGAWVYFGSAVVILGIELIVFRVIVGRDYSRFGRLTPLSIFLQYVAIVVWACFGWMNIPNGWPDVYVGPVQAIIGWALFGGGWLITLAGILVLGIRRSHGLQVDVLRRSRMYGATRNPQAVAFLTAMIGYLVLWPSWPNVGVLILIVILAHLMILAEEEHLSAVFGDDYERYRMRVPRYVRVRRASSAE